MTNQLEINNESKQIANISFISPFKSRKIGRNMQRGSDHQTEIGKE